MYNQAAWDIANELEAFYAQPVPAVVPEVPIAFNMNDWGARTECGTVACLAGSIMAMRAPEKFIAYADGALYHRPWDFASNLLGLEPGEDEKMFIPVGCGRYTLQDALKMLRHYAQTGKIVWE